MLTVDGRGALVAEESLFDYFRARVEQAVKHQRAPVSESAVYYLSSVLAEQGHREEEEPPTTLVELRERASTAPLGEAVSLWKRLGDNSLVAVGYFREHLRHRHLSPSYYAEMGQSAYAVLARALRDPDCTVHDIFGELAERYEACAAVITEVRDEARECNSSDIVKLYEEFLRTGSPRVAERLRQLGVVPVRARAAG